MDLPPREMGEFKKVFENNGIFDTKISIKINV
jgi:hypothetical protein